MPIITDVVNSNPAHGKVYFIKHYVIKFVSELWQIVGFLRVIGFLHQLQLLAHFRWFSPGTPASSTTETGHHDIAEILLKVALKHRKSTTNVVSSNPTQAIQRYVIKFVSNLRQVSGFLQYPPPIKLTTTI